MRLDPQGPSRDPEFLLLAGEDVNHLARLADWLTRPRAKE
jgi:hypothetical protein